MFFHGDCRAAQTGYQLAEEKQARSPALLLKASAAGSALCQEWTLSARIDTSPLRAHPGRSQCPTLFQEADVTLEAASRSWASGPSSHGRLSLRAA